jgi:hypothetical protein
MVYIYNSVQHTGDRKSRSVTHQLQNRKFNDKHLLITINCFNLKRSVFNKLNNCKFNVHGSVHRKYIPIYIQQDATLHSLLYLETAPHVSGGTSTHHQERTQLYLQHLVFVTPLLLSAAILKELELVSVCCGWLTVEYILL